MQCMVASSIPCKLSLCADRAHACAGDSYVSSGIDVACPTTQSVLAIASPHELHGDSWPSSSTGTRSFCCNQQYSVTAVTTSGGAIAERYAYSAYGQPTILDASGAVLQTSNFSIHTSYTGRECLAGACGISGSISMPGNGFTPFRYDFCKEYNCTRWSDPVVCFGKSKRVCFEHEDFCTFYWRHANNGTVPPEPKANEF